MCHVFAVESAGVTLLKDSEKAIFLLKDLDGRYFAKENATTRDVGVSILRARFVWVRPIAKDSIFHTNYPRDLRETTIQRKAPYFICRSTEYAMGTIYYRLLKGGVWSEERSHAASGHLFEIIHLAKDVEGVRITKVQFK